MSLQIDLLGTCDAGADTKAFTGAGNRHPDPAGACAAHTAVVPGYCSRDPFSVELSICYATPKG
jgi:hypothetical protein